MGDISKKTSSEKQNVKLQDTLEMTKSSIKNDTPMTECKYAESNFAKGVYIYADIKNCIHTNILLTNLS